MSQHDVSRRFLVHGDPKLRCDKALAAGHCSMTQEHVTYSQEKMEQGIHGLGLPGDRNAHDSLPEMATTNWTDFFADFRTKHPPRTEVPMIVRKTFTPIDHAIAVATKLRKTNLDGSGIDTKFFHRTCGSRTAGRTAIKTRSCPIVTQEC